MPVFSQSWFRSINFILFVSILYLASPSSLQSGNICKSIFCSVFLPSLGFSPHVFLFTFLVEPCSLDRSLVDHSNLNGLLESQSTEREFEISRRSDCKICKLHPQPSCCVRSLITAGQEDKPSGKRVFSITYKPAFILLL